MLRRTTLFALCALVALPMFAQRQRRTPSVMVQPAAPDVVGLIQYDTGVPGSTLLGPGLAGGNRFSSASGNPLISGTVDTLVFYPMSLPNPSNNAVSFTFWGAPSGGNAPFITMFAAGAVNNSSLQMATGLGIVVPNDFLAGLYLGTLGTGLGADAGSVAPQGFHAFTIVPSSYASGTGFNALSNLNAVYRVGGDILIPVELTEFEIE